MTPTQQEIAAIARLVPDHVRVMPFADGPVRRFFYRVNDGRDWQPWADTEAGRGDWAVLDTAVCHWLWEFHLLGKDPHPELADACDKLADAQQSGDLKQRQLATFAAALAIGRHMREAE